MHVTRSAFWALVLVGCTLLSGCPAGGKNTADGADDDDGDGGAPDEPRNESGQVDGAWSDYCVASFVEDVDVLDAFGDVQLRAKSGDAYLLLTYADDFGQPKATLGYLTSAGPYPIEVIPTASTDFPFTSNCSFGGGVEYYAVYADVDLFRDAELTTRLCSLTAGTAVRRDASQATGFAIAGPIELFAPSVYEIQLNALGPFCGGAQSGFALVQQTEVLDTTTGIIPIGPVLGP